MTITDDELAARREERGVVTDNAADDTPEQDTDDVPAAEAEPVAEPALPKPMQIPIPGTFGGISASPGGSAPTSSEARLLGASLPIEGEFEGEEVVTLIVEAKVGEVAFVYTTDAWGNTTAVRRRHKMRAVSVRRA